MLVILKAGSTSQSIDVSILDSSSTSGARKTGIVYNAAGLTAYYKRPGGSPTAITLATLAAINSAYSSGGFKEADATNMPGIYRLDVPDAMIAAGVPYVTLTIRGASGMVQVDALIMLTAIDLQDSVRQGMTALPNAAAEAAGGIYTRGSGAGQINQSANGQIDVNTVKVEGLDATDQMRDSILNDATRFAGATISAINAKTTNLPASPASEGNVTAVGNAVASLNNLSAAQVNSEVVNALSVDAYAEPGSIPAASTSLAEKIGFIYTFLRNKKTNNGVVKTLRNDADSGSIGTSAISDDGTTFTENEWL